MLRIDDATRMARLMIVAMFATLGGCSVQQMAVNRVADSLSSAQGGAFSQDEDLAFVGEATPFALKMMESIAAQAPEHSAIRISLAAGFVQYATVYVAWPAEQQRFTDLEAYRRGQRRARDFHLRANAYAHAALEIDHPGLVDALLANRPDALAGTARADVPALFWLAASWLSALSLDLEDPRMIGLLPTSVRLLRHCQSLDPAWNRGALAEALIAVETKVPGGDGAARARLQFERALDVGGERAGPYVSLALATALPAQDRAGFVELLEHALAIDVANAPENRLANLYARERAGFYLQHIDELFVD